MFGPEQLQIDLLEYDVEIHKCLIFAKKSNYAESQFKNLNILGADFLKYHRTKFDYSKRLVLIEEK